MPFPHMIRVRQTFDTTHINDPEKAVRHQIEAKQSKLSVTPGQSVAVACSSRGIANYPYIVKGVVTGLKQLGLAPFLIPAMGSHGSGNAKGQARVLAHLGITETAVGAPIRSSLDVIQFGKTEAGIPVYVDETAASADHIVLINRIKKHTEFSHEFESGLMKMMAIGLGKQAGAAVYHQAMMTFGYPGVILSIARRVMARTNILFGVGIVENGYGETANIGIGTVDDIERMEIGLLKLAKKYAPALPFDEADILIIDEMGKDISGTGFDTKVVGRIGLPLITADPEKPDIKRILVSDLTPGSEGNAVGVGVADFITKRLYHKIDMDALYMNTITGACPESGRIPVTMESDKAALEAAVLSVGLIPTGKLKIMRIKNTARLEDVDVSEACAAMLHTRPDLEIVKRAHPMIFDDNGYFPPF